MNLIIDIGNTRCKLAVFENDEIIFQNAVPELTVSDIEKLKQQFPWLSKAILASVRDYQASVHEFLQKKFDLFIQLDHQIPVPIKNLYKSPETLGYDRLAVAIGATEICPGKNLLIIDAGTAITYEFVSENNEYLGGNISPGLKSRFQALHDYTGKLPLVNQNENYYSIGHNTESAIRTGVQMGLLFEVEKYIEFFKSKYHDITVFITGGDAIFFEKNIKSSIFVDFNLILKGLNEILKFNDRSLD